MRPVPAAQRARRQQEQSQSTKVLIVPHNVTSPVAGKVIRCLVQLGETVTADTEVAIVESMKMHIPVVAERTGLVAVWLVSEDSQVAEGQALLTLEG